MRQIGQYVKDNISMGGRGGWGHWYILATLGVMAMSGMRERVKAMRGGVDEKDLSAGTDRDRQRMQT
jgi:hypothetical protein